MVGPKTLNVVSNGFCSQVVSYIGREGEAVKANAAASLCPAWDISKAFGRLQTKYPRLDRYITQSIINLFIR